MLVALEVSHTVRKHRLSTLLSSLVGILICLLGFEAYGQSLNLGPLRVDFGLQAGFDYTDNFNNSETNRVSDLSWFAGPTGSGGLSLPIHIGSTGGEEMTINAGFGYSYKYSLNGNGGGGNFNAPVAVDVFVPLTIEKWQFVLGDSFSFSNDPLLNTVDVNRESTSQYNNLASVNTTRNFGRFGINFSAQRTDLWTPDTPETEETSYLFAISPSFLIRENYSAFISTSYGIYLPDDPHKQDVNTIAVSVGVTGQITPYLTGTTSIGYAHSHLDKLEYGTGDGIFGGAFDPTVVKADSIDGITSTVALSYSHPLRPDTTYSLSFTRSPGVTTLLKDSNIQEVESVGLNVSHRLTPRLTLSPQFGWTHVSDAGNGGNGEVVDIFSAQLYLRRSFTQRVNAALSYIFQKRSSNIDGSSYDVNQVNMTINCNF